MLNLNEAAKESGQSKSAVWRAVMASCWQSGPSPATTRSTHPFESNWHGRFLPIVVSMRRDPTELEPAEAASMQEQIERLFEVGRQIRKELDTLADA